MGDGAGGGLVCELRGQVGPCGDAELAEDVPQVGLDRGQRDGKVLGDLPVGQAVGGEGGDLPLGAGQRVRAGQGGSAGPGTGGQEFSPGLLGQRCGTGPLREV
ncbi:MAG TPA: hypothetical protein VHY31_01790 [Streptosporangiaceae bacterium]|nr:hypothetical protein [Streptosporangiaceae bacterium]